jgi:hypothetical protein
MNKAILAVAHQMLVTALSILRDQSEYCELGGDFFDHQHPQRARNRLVVAWRDWVAGRDYAR